MSIKHKSSERSTVNQDKSRTFSFVSCLEQTLQSYFLHCFNNQNRSIVTADALMVLNVSPDQRSFSQGSNTENVFELKPA